MAGLRNRIFDFERIMLFADSPEAGKRARLQFSCRDVNPRVTVFTGVSGAAKNGIISGPLDFASFDNFLTHFEAIIKGSPGVKSKLVCKYPVYKNDKPTDDVQIISELWYGKNNDGIVWISLVAEGYPKIVFEFHGSKFVDFYRTDGTLLTEVEKSSLAAGAYVNTLRQLIPIHIHAVSMEDRVIDPNKNNQTSTKSTMKPAVEFDELTY